MNPVAFLETGVIECADNLDTLSGLPAGCIDLIYLDPPFFSNRHQQTVWGREHREFEDQWEGGMTFYLDYMHKRIRHMHRVLKPTGSLYFHCDWHASHHLKVMLDSIFGMGQFRNEIIWKRTSAHSGAKRYGPVHDTILFYTRGSEFTWNPQHQAYDARYLESKYRYKDSQGRPYRLSDITGPGKRTGPSGQPWRDYDPTSIGRHWQPPSYCYDKYQALTGEDLAQYPLIERLDKLDELGLIHWPQKAGGRPEHKRFLEDMPGVALQDVWTDLDPVNARAVERIGYPTQKPEALLERIIAASSNPGDIVLDPFCGCGTTIAVAERLNRQWIGIDKSPTAVSVMKRRMDAMGATDVRVDGLPVTLADLKRLDPFEFQSWIVQRVLGTPSPRKSGDLGIDGLSFFEELPIQVKQQEGIGRKVLDEFETAIKRHGSHKGYIVAFSFGRGAVDEAARTRLDKNEPEVVLVKVADLLRVGELVEAAERERETPESAPDLMGIFSTKQRLAEEFPLAIGVSGRPKRKARKRPDPQLQLGVSPSSARDS